MYFKRLFFVTLFILTTFTSLHVALYVKNIQDCPTLTPRKPPQSVHDLRVDDIKVIGALGDSATSGFSLKGYKNSTSIISDLMEAILEYRGLAYSIGGDENAFTVANYIKNYQPNLQGSSIGQRITGVCNEKDCYGATDTYHDRFNAALSGGTAQTLERQLDYLIPTMKNSKIIDFDKDWKIINIQIGSLDMCNLCKNLTQNEYTPEKYGKYLEAAVDRIYKNIPNVIVNLISNYDVAGVSSLTAQYKNHCALKYDIVGCACSKTIEGLYLMSRLSLEYNNKLKEITEKYQKMNIQNFAVILQRSGYDFFRFSMDYFSTLDCFYPSLKGHEWTSKIIWNQLFLSQFQKPKYFVFDDQEAIYCPADFDRIMTR
ncbi:hypothetical protein BD770DRAFT_407870 [Pilaira anomala]|nr:hypothetical protein BD770DRAFT_407870 [Pilaira anomala]